MRNALSQNIKTPTDYFPESALSIEVFQDLIRAAYKIDGEGFGYLLKGETPGPDFNANY